jgi:hypothetical protein
MGFQALQPRIYDIQKIRYFISYDKRVLTMGRFLRRFYFPLLEFQHLQKQQPKRHKKIHKSQLYDKFQNVTRANSKRFI